MSMRDIDLIHGLTFDFAFGATSEESTALADWVQAELLPVVEEVLDQFRGVGRRRIERLDIDLGTVAAAQARGELAWRLHAQLSAALAQSLDEAGPAGTGTIGAHGPGADMLAFLGTGTLPWAAAGDADAGHKALLRDAIGSPQAYQVLSAALREANMLTRLVRQFDAPALLAAAQVLFGAWAPTERGAALAWAADTVQHLQDSGAEGEPFWRWFLPQYAHPVSPATLTARWRQASAEQPAATTASGVASAGFDAHAMAAIEQGLERADFALLAPYWDRILACAPQCLRSAHPRLWQRWTDQFDDATLADVLCVVQADCAWLIGMLATLVPRTRLHALMRPAMRQWLAAPVDSLAPQPMLEWARAALPDQATHIGALLPAASAGERPRPGAPARSAIAAPTDARLLAALRDLCSPWAPVQREAMLAWAGGELGRLRDARLAPASFWRWLLPRCARGAGVDVLMHEWTRVRQGAMAAQAASAGMDQAGFSPGAMRAIGHGLETADFALLAPYWERILASAPQCLRDAHPRCWERWSRNFDDATLIDIVGVVQAGCAWLIGSFATVVPGVRQHGQLRPALQQWLAAPVDRLAPQRVLDWMEAAVPEQCAPIAALFAAQALARTPPVQQDRAGVEAFLLAGAPAQSRPAVQAGSLAPLENAAVPAQSGRATALPAAQATARTLQDSAHASLIAGALQAGSLAPQMEAASPEHAERAADLFAAREATQGPHAQHDAEHALFDGEFAQSRPAVAGSGWSPSDMQAIGQGLETADFALLAPHWKRLLSSAPQSLRSAHPRRWQQWLRNFDDATLADIFCVVQADCAWLIDGLATALPRARLHAQLRPALQQWLAVPVDQLAPQVVQQWLAASMPAQSVQLRAMGAAQHAASERQVTESVANPGAAVAQWLAAAHLLFAPWPQAQRDAVMAWAGEQLQRHARAGSDSAAFRRWFLRHCGAPVALADLMRQWSAWSDAAAQPGTARNAEPTWSNQPGQGTLAALLSDDAAGHGLAPEAAARAYQQLCAALRAPQAFARLVRQLNAQQLLAAADVLFSNWPRAERDSALAWAADEVQRRRDAGADVASFWEWFLPLHADPAALDALMRDEQGAPAQGPAMPAALFSPEQDAHILQGLGTAQFDLLAPHWGRLLAHAPQRIRAAHPRLWRTWLATFSDDVVIDILSAVQPDCKSMLEGMTALMSRERLLPLLKPVLAAWFGTAPGRLAPGVMLMHVMKAAPHDAAALSALFPARAQGAANTAGDRRAAVDSKHFREPLRVLGPLFARAEIITISKALNAGQFAPLAPYWDRLLVLAPHWLRSEYPRLARTWAAGFDDEVLIDILSVVQAECCALIEQLASTLPRDRLHAALRPSLAGWFELELDRLAPQAIVDDVLRATDGKPAALQAMLSATAHSVERGTVAGVDRASLEQVIERADSAQLQRMWPSVVVAQRPQLRRIWNALPQAARERAIERFMSELGLAQQVDLALILQPAVVMLVAELQQHLGDYPERAAILGTALRYLLHADVASAVPQRLMHCVQERHGAWCAAVPLAQTRHIAAALASASPAPAVQEVQEVQGAAWASARLSAEALRNYVAACRSADAQLKQLDSAQLHGLVKAWAGFEQAGDAAGAFLAATEAGALAAAAPHAFFGKVLQQALLGEAIDLEAIGADCTTARAPVVAPVRIEDLTAGRDEMLPVAAPLHGGPSPLSELLCQALPQRLAESLLRADLSALDALWPDIVTHHPALLGQAAQRYLGRAEVRNRLIGNTDGGKMLDLLGCLSAWAAQLVAPLVERAASFSATLPAALAPDAFGQRILRFAFTQVMDQPAPAAPAAWLSGLLASVLPARAQNVQCALVAHAWYEMLRDGESPLASALEHTLFGSAYLAVAQQRLRSGPDAGIETALPDALQQVLTMELCDSHPALTDQLLADGAFADADASAFSAAEWQALARAQLPRQQREAQLRFWRAFTARMPTPGTGRSAHEDDLQAAYAAAFGVLAQPAWQAADAARTPRAPADPALSAASADSIAILLMRERAPDAAVHACLQLLIQRLLFNAGGSSAAHAALHSALADRRARDRLLDILPGPTAARLLCLLHPALAGALPAALRAIGELVPISLSAVPAMLEGDVWRAVFDAVFAGPTPADSAALAGALATRLAGEPAQDGAALPTPGGAPAHAATPAEAMAQLLQPLAKPQAEPAARALRSDDAPLPFTGDANLRNAGLVLVAPYIERLFDLFGITQGGQFVSDAARERGVHVLQYVVTAEESTPEHLLSLNKLLCGIPAAVPVALGISISDKEKDTIEGMLRGVIANWSAIGASSVTGLRETFLQREGCLYYQDDAWHLKIPQRTFDMLLDRLPWSYKLIKFSWMAAPLNVAWR